MGGYPEKGGERVHPVVQSNVKTQKKVLERLAKEREGELIGVSYGKPMEEECEAYGRLKPKYSLGDKHIFLVSGVTVRGFGIHSNADNYSETKIPAEYLKEYTLLIRKGRKE